MRFAAALLAALLLAAPALAGPDWYVRNRPVQGRPAGADVFVDEGRLPRLFTPAEMDRIAVEAGQVLVDGQAVAATDASGGVPVGAVARALGFELRRNTQLDTVDLVPPAALLTNDKRPPAAGMDPKRRPEYRLSAERMKQVLRVLPEIPDHPEIERLDRIGNRVADATPLGDLPWHFYIVEEADPNAACVGEGHVFVTSGLMEMKLSDDELAGVLGHEIAHGVKRHTFRFLDMLEEFADLEREIEALSEAEYRSRTGRGPAPGAVALENRKADLLRRAESLLYRLEHERAYDRTAEEEADILGIQYAVTAGFGADGLGWALMKLKAASVVQFGQAVLEDLMTHPPLERRLEILRRVRASWR